MNSLSTDLQRLARQLLLAQRYPAPARPNWDDMKQVKLINSKSPGRKPRADEDFGNKAQFSLAAEHESMQQRYMSDADTPWNLSFTAEPMVPVKDIVTGETSMEFVDPNTIGIDPNDAASLWLADKRVEDLMDRADEFVERLVA